MIRRRDSLFWLLLSVPGVFYVGLIVSLIVAMVQYLTWQDLSEAWSDQRIRYALQLSLISSSLSAFLSLWFAVPTGYVLARMTNSEPGQWTGRTKTTGIFFRSILDTILDIPIVLPPLVIGMGLLVLFQTAPGRWVDEQTGRFFIWLGYPGIQGISFEIPAILLAQTFVAAAFAIRTLRDTFDQINPRPEQVGRTLGASQRQVFLMIAFPQAWRGIRSAFTLAWARSFGEFGPILIFAGTTRMKTEVLPTSIYLNFQSGNLGGAVAVSVMMMGTAVALLVGLRWAGLSGRHRSDRTHQKS